MLCCRPIQQKCTGPPSKGSFSWRLCNFVHAPPNLKGRWAIVQSRKVTHVVNERLNLFRALIGRVRKFSIKRKLVQESWPTFGSSSNFFEVRSICNFFLLWKPHFPEDVKTTQGSLGEKVLFWIVWCDDLSPFYIYGSMEIMQFCCGAIHFYRVQRLELMRKCVRLSPQALSNSSWRAINLVVV